VQQLARRVLVHRIGGIANDPIRCNDITPLNLSITTGFFCFYELPAGLHQDVAACADQFPCTILLLLL
jgi:hypothetical protein